MAMYNDEETMLPHLPSLCPIGHDELKRRRDRDREAYRRGTGLFWDVVDKGAGAMVGTAGFTSINHAAGEAEWGILVAKPWRGRGLCREVFHHCVAILKASMPGVFSIRASTTADNAPMAAFLSGSGFHRVRNRKADGADWHDYTILLRDVPAPRPPPTCML